MAAILADTEAHGKEAQLSLAVSYPWHDLRFQHTAALRAQLAQDHAAGTVNKMLSALRQVLKRAWRLGLMSREDYARAADVEGVKGETLPAGRSLSGGELDALMTACAEDATAAGARDGAMLALLYSCGLRRAELAALTMADLDAEAGKLTIHGKGNKARLAHVVNGADAALDDWLTVRGLDDGPIFCPIDKGGNLHAGEGITAQAVYNMLDKRTSQAGLTETASPHDFRRTFVGDLLDAGADIATVQHLAGHANVTTTTRYDRRPEAAKRKAASLLHIPYRRRKA